MASLVRSLTSPRSSFLSLAIMAALSLAACATLPGCDEKTAAGVATVTIKGKKFHLEIAADNDKRYLGLGKRTSIDDDGGMIFVFPEPSVQAFVMRDCPIDIDIIYVDAAGRILAKHAMTKEDPRRPDESADMPSQDTAYNDRLKRYPSRYPCQFVIEIQGGMIAKLGLTDSDKVTFDADALKKLAR